MNSEDQRGDNVCDGCGAELQLMRMELQSISRTVNLINDRIMGRGTSSDPGMVVRLDRVEQQAERTAVWLKAVIGSLVTAIFSGIVWAASKLTKI